MTERQWIPLESNPEVLTKFGRALGLPESVSFEDVWSLDLLDMVPAPRHAVLLLFPITDRLQGAGEHSSGNQSTTTDSLGTPFFCKQTIPNACGTIALLHAAINSPISLDDGSFLNLFLERTKDLSPDERAAALQSDSTLDAVHEQFAQVCTCPIVSSVSSLSFHNIIHSGFIRLLTNSLSLSYIHTYCQLADRCLVSLLGIITGGSNSSPE